MEKYVTIKSEKWPSRPQIAALFLIRVQCQTLLTHICFCYFVWIVPNTGEEYFLWITCVSIIKEFQQMIVILFDYLVSLTIKSSDVEKQEKFRMKCFSESQ